MALVAADVGWVDDVDVDFDIDDLDVIQDFDLVDDDRQFRGGGGGGGAYFSAIFSDADIVSHCRRGCEDDGDGDGDAAAACSWLLAGLGNDDDDCGGGAEDEAGSSPADSGVTDGDGPLSSSAEADDTAAEAVSAYVADLERFLLEDDDVDDDEQTEVDQGVLGVVDDYFSSDQLLPTADVVTVADAAARTDGEEEEENSHSGDVGNGIVPSREDEQQSASTKRARYK